MPLRSPKVEQSIANSSSLKEYSSSFALCLSSIFPARHWSKISGKNAANCVVMAGEQGESGLVSFVETDDAEIAVDATENIDGDGLRDDVGDDVDGDALRR